MVIATFYLGILAAVSEKGIMVDEALAIAKDNGITAMEIAPNMFESDEEVETFLPMLERHGMHVSSAFSCPYCRVKTEEQYAQSLAEMKAGVDFAKRMKSRYFMAVPLIPVDALEEEYELYRTGFRRLLADTVKYGTEVGIQVTVEDFSLREIPYSTYEDIDWLLENIPGLMFTYDSGNFPLTGHDELESVKRYADRTVHVHLKDLKVVDHSEILRDGKYYDSLEIGGGYLKNKEALAYLDEKGYEGAVVIEVCAADRDMFDRTIKSAQYLRGILNV